MECVYRAISLPISGPRLGFLFIYRDRARPSARNFYSCRLRTACRFA